MSRADAAISGTLAIFRREITRAHYRVSIDHNATPMEIEAEDFAERLLGLGKWERTGGWFAGGFRELLNRGCDAFSYGFSPNEMVWGSKVWNGRPVTVPVKLPWRAPWSVERWLWKGDDLVSMGQLVQAEMVPGVHIRARRNIPADKLLMFVHDYRDGNPEGTSILRSAWLPWRAKKDTILRHQEAEDTLFGGFATLEEGGTPENGPFKWATEQDLDKFKAAFEDWRNGWLDWLSVPYGYDVNSKHPEFQIPSRVAELKYYDHQIFLGGLAALLGLDASHAASKALSDGLGALMYRGLDAAVKSTILPTINGVVGRPWTGLLRKAIDANFDTGPDFRYPTVEVVGLDSPDVSTYVDRTTKAARYNLVTMGAKDEVDFRRINGMAHVPLDELEELRGAQVDDESAVVGVEAVEAVQDTALNGAQVAALQGILQSVSAGELAARAAELMITNAFPAIDNDEATEMVESAASLAPDPDAEPAPIIEDDSEEDDE